MKTFEILANSKPGDHFCLLYETDAEHMAVLGKFLRLGLERNEKVLCIAEPDFVSRVQRHFGRKHFVTGACLKNLRLVPISFADLKGKRELTPDRLIDFMRAELESALSQGYRAVRIATEITPLLQGFDLESLMDFESRLDAFFNNHCTGLCLYDLRRMNAAWVLDLLLTHPTILIGMEANENCYYLPSSKSLREGLPRTIPYFLLKILTERKDFESKLNERKELIKRYFNMAGTILLVLNRRGQVVSINMKGCEVLGYSHERIVGKNWFDHFVPESNRKGVQNSFDRWMKGEKRGHEYSVNPILTDNGEQRLISWHNTAISDDSGALRCILSSGEDITARQRNEAALRRSEEKYCALFENAVEGIFQSTKQGKLLNVNPAYAQMLGFSSPAEMIASIDNFAEQHYVRPEDRKVLDALIEKDGVVQHFETQLHRRNGEKIWISINARAVRNGKGKLLYYEGMVEDITARKESEERLGRTLANLRIAMEGTIHAVAMTVEAKDPYTAGHQQHVAMLARAIANRLGLSEDFCEGIYLAGVIHDLGKISIPTEFLTKPGKLTDFEYTLIKTHPEAGFKILNGIDFPWPVAEIVRQHHERLNGSGYPRGLERDHILLEARIVAIADVVESMTFHRPYRPAYGLNLALQEISKHADTLYENSAVQACMKLFLEENFTWGRLFSREANQA
jgi:PAS domain S-box-containing protein